MRVSRGGWYSSAWLWTALALSASGCGAAADPPPPGYSGPLPSARGQAVLGELQGQVLEDRTGALGGGRFVIGPFGVIPNPVTGKGPVVVLAKEGPGDAGEEVRHLPVEREADVADLFERITGAASPLVRAGETSTNYRRALGLP